MKKIGLMAILTIFTALVMVGCGSNSKQDPIVVSPYSFFNASTPFEVYDNSDNNITMTYELSVQLLKNGYAFEGEIVTMLPFDRKYGFITNTSDVVTDINGWAVFPYEPPTDVTSLIGQSATISATYDDGNGTVLVQNFVLKFVAGSVASSSGGSCTTGSTCPLLNP